MRQMAVTGIVACGMVFVPALWRHALRLIAIGAEAYRCRCCCCWRYLASCAMAELLNSARLAAGLPEV